MGVSVLLVCVVLCCWLLIEKEKWDTQAQRQGYESCFLSLISFSLNSPTQVWRKWQPWPGQSTLIFIATGKHIVFSIALYFASAVFVLIIPRKVTLKQSSTACGSPLQARENRALHVRTDKPDTADARQIQVGH